MSEQLLERAEKIANIQKAILKIMLDYEFDFNMAYLSLKLLVEKMETDFPKLKERYELMKDGR